MGPGKVFALAKGLLAQLGLAGASSGDSSTAGTPNFDALTLSGQTANDIKLEVNSNGILDVRLGDDSADGRIAASAGSTASPGFQFADDRDNGIYRSGSNAVGIVAGGGNRLNVSATAIAPAV